MSAVPESSTMFETLRLISPYVLNLFCFLLGMLYTLWLTRGKRKE